MAFDALARAKRFSNHTPRSDTETILLSKGVGPGQHVASRCEPVQGS
jgi:hypothetical protein